MRDLNSTHPNLCKTPRKTSGLQLQINRRSVSKLNLFCDFCTHGENNEILLLENCG